MSGDHARKYCSAVHLGPFLNWLSARGFELLLHCEPDESHRLKRGRDLLCIMPRSQGTKFTVNLAQVGWLMQFKHNLNRRPP